MSRVPPFVIGLALVASACGRGSPPLSAEPSGVASQSAPATADPLEGKWRQDFTCLQLVRILRRWADPTSFDRWAADIVGGMEGAVTPPPKDDLCAGAPATFERIAKFANGHVVFFDPPRLQADGLNAPYRLVNDHTFVVNDTIGNVSPSPLTCSFLIRGDRLALRPQTRDPWTLSGFRVAPFLRID